RLHHVNFAARNQVVETPGRCFLLPGRQPGGHTRLFNPRVAVITLGMQEIFYPKNPVWLQSANELDGIIGAPVHHPTWVNQQFNLGPNRFARGGDQGYILPPVPAKCPPAELNRRKSAAEVELASTLHVVGRLAEQGGSVGTNALAVRAA